MPFHLANVDNHMNKFLIALALCFSITACTQPLETSTAGEDLSTEVDTVSDSDPDYVDEGAGSAADPLAGDQFRVDRRVAFEGSDAITVQKITDGVLVVNKITVNRGNCALLSEPDPTNMHYSSTMTVYLWGCDAGSVLEVGIETDQGYATYQFN